MLSCWFKYFFLLYHLIFEFTVIFHILWHIKKINITIKEDVAFLNNSYSKTASHLQQDRIKTLIYLVTKKYHYQSDIAKRLGRTEKTIRDWLKLYATRGFDALITVKSG